MSHHFVEIKNLSYSYHNPSANGAQVDQWDAEPMAVLQNISFRIGHGEAVGLIGANGAGKSTLLQHLNGCLLSTKGEVRIGDIPVTKNTLKEIRRTVGVVFQDPDDQLFMPRVFDDVAFGPLNIGLPMKDVEERVARVLDRVGARHLQARAPYELSGGEKKRVAIAAVLAMDPSILVMDEPTNGLDPYARRQVISILKSFDHTKIIATHDLDMVMEVCDRVIILQGGRVRADGTPKEIFDQGELLAECHLEKPLSLQGCALCGSHSFR